MKTLLLLRHAKSSWDEPNLSDHDRPLNARGLRDAPRMGDLIERQGLTPDLIVASTATRAQMTARLVAEHCNYSAPIDSTPSLYLASPDQYVSYLRCLDDRYTLVLVVGHNPGLEDLLEQIAGSYEKMPTAALAHLSLAIRSWQDFRAKTDARLVHLWRPKELS
jgi:phosphohistidine phosphatase